MTSDVVNTGSIALQLNSANIASIFTPACSIFTNVKKEVYTNPKDLIISSGLITDGSGKSFLDGQFSDSAVSEMIHIAEVKENFNYKAYIREFEFAYKDRDQVDPVSVYQQTMQKLMISYDIDAWFGDLQKTQNLGYFSNPNNVTNSTGTTIDSVDSLSRLVRPLARNIQALTGCNESDIGYVFTGSGFDDFFVSTTGAGIKSYRQIFEENFGFNYVLLSPAVYASSNVGNAVSVFCNPRTVFNECYSPDMHKSGYDDRKSEKWYRFWKGSNAVNVVEKGSVQTVSNITVSLPTLP